MLQPFHPLTFAAADLVQTALLRTGLRWRQAGGNPDVYARQALVNLARDGWRRRRRRGDDLRICEASRSRADRRLRLLARRRELTLAVFIVAAAAGSIGKFRYEPAMKYLALSARLQ